MKTIIVLILLVCIPSHGYLEENKVCEFELKYDKTEKAYWKCVDGLKITNECEHELKDSCDPDIGLSDGTPCIMQFYCCQAKKGMEDRDVKNDCKRGKL